MSFICFRTVDCGVNAVSGDVSDDDPWGATYLARFTGTKQEHFNLIFGLKAITLELAFDLVVTCGGWLVS
jgi:hypothetical protein